MKLCLYACAASYNVASWGFIACRAIALKLCHKGGLHFSCLTGGFEWHTWDIVYQLLFMFHLQPCMFLCCHILIEMKFDWSECHRHGVMLRDVDVVSVLCCRVGSSLISCQCWWSGNILLIRTYMTVFPAVIATCLRGCLQLLDFSLSEQCSYLL